jgi:hypothetical protein
VVMISAQPNGTHYLHVNSTEALDPEWTYQEVVRPVIAMSQLQYVICYFLRFFAIKDFYWIYCHCIQIYDVANDPFKTVRPDEEKTFSQVNSSLFYRLDIIRLTFYMYNNYRPLIKHKGLINKKY